ncbi:Hypothetical predicted protein [Lecanosticta acicola]|uniref:Uncharacterized protein n=1 Tax=Lecanosticta acicola TaxID=111012 RepID=A0AAI8YX21_9PEZI|nr:Hypothetical predicted protein [Lecanosticta acicola]
MDAMHESVSHGNSNTNPQTRPEEEGKRRAVQQALMGLFSTGLETPTAQNSEYDRLQMSVPRWMWFLDVYLDRYKNGLLEINPAARGAQRQVRRLLAELLYETIEAATEDLNETFRTTERNGSNDSASSRASTRGGSPAEDEQTEEAVMGILDMSEEGKQEPDGDTVRLRALGDIVRIEMDGMAEAAKEAVENLV